jgi:hypothetical protein
MCRCAAITTMGSVVRRAALWQSEDKKGRNLADTVLTRSAQGSLARSNPSHSIQSAPQGKMPCRRRNTYLTERLFAAFSMSSATAFGCET